MGLFKDYTDSLENIDKTENYRMLLSEKNIRKQNFQLMSITQKLSEAAEIFTERACKILMVLNGEITLTVNGETLNCKSEDLIIINRFESPIIIDGFSKDCKLIALAVNNFKLGSLSRDCLIKGRDFVKLSLIDDSQKLISNMNELFDNFIKSSPLNQLLSDNFLRIVIIKILQFLEYDISFSNSKNDTFTKALDYLNTYFCLDESLEEIAKKLNVTSFYLCRLFKEQMEVTPNKYITNLRIAKAKKLLNSTDANIVDIARECGYSDLSYFCRVFKSVTDLSPLKYRLTSRL